MGDNRIKPGGKWATKVFDDAVLARGVGWMVIQWEIQHEPDRGCEDCHDYTMFPNQFNDMPKDMPYTEVEAIFNAHVANRIEHNATVHRDRDPVRISLFLCRVQKVVNITNDHGNLIDPVKTFVNTTGSRASD